MSGYRRKRTLGNSKKPKGKAPLTPSQPSQEDNHSHIDNITNDVEALSFTNGHRQEAITVSCGQIDQLTWYVRCLLFESRWFALARDNTYAIADCDAKGTLRRRNYQLLQAKEFQSSEGDHCVIFSCSCKEAREQSDRLAATANRVTREDLSKFAEREEGLYCLHARAAKRIIPTPLAAQEEEEEEVDEDESEDSSGSVEQLQTEPFLAAAHDGKTYGILKRQGEKGRLSCVTCSSRQMSCTHVTSYKAWCKDRDVDPDVVFTTLDEPKFKSVSTSRIPYPWTQEMKEKFSRYRVGTYPRDLVPDVPSGECSHGHAWDQRDPVVHKWIQNVGVIIYTRHYTLTDYDTTYGEHHPRIAYYRPTVADCNCRHYYDGSEDLLHNIDNRSMFCFGFLADYLKAMVLSKEPLRATHRVCNEFREDFTVDRPIPYETLRRGWNSWARRLDIDWIKVFTCDLCGPEPKTVICDGTAIGFRKDLIDHLSSPTTTEDQPETPVVTGSRHCDRVFINCAKSRELLLRYSDIKRKRPGGSGISEAEMEELQHKLKVKRTGRGDVAALLRRLQEEGYTTHAPRKYSKFLSELARSTPVCGMVQIAGDKNAIRIMKKVAVGDIDLTNSRFHSYLGHVQKEAPVLTKFICSVTEAGRIPHDVSILVLSLMTVLKETFEKVEVPSSSCYPAPLPPSLLSFFPSLPLLCGLPRYAMNEARKPKDKDSCRKESYGHPTLTPGLFTIYCQHGVCYGFEAMRSCESPQHPFEIFRTRFKVAPKVIVYDNACQLHRYVMNREPHFFKKTKFLVDRFHFPNHVGCSLGYCMSSYTASFDINAINSQVVEQANSGLIRIQPQLAYMLPLNFMFHASLFLAMKNTAARTKMACK